MVTRFEELIRDEANDESTPEELFLTAVDEALELRRFSRIEKLIRQAGLPLGITPSRPAATTNTGRADQSDNPAGTESRQYQLHGPPVPTSPIR